MSVLLEDAEFLTGGYFALILIIIAIISIEICTYLEKCSHRTQVIIKIIMIFIIGMGIFVYLYKWDAIVKIIIIS